MKTLDVCKIKRVSAALFLIMIGISWPLWWPLDSVGTLPFAWTDVPRFLNWSISGVLVMALAFIVYRPNDIAAIVFACCLFAACSIDGNRAQPWLAAFLLPIFIPTELPNRAALFPYTLLLALTYLLSGIQKFNVDFCEEVWPWILQSFGLSGFEGWAISPPIYETAIGVCLAIPALRRVGIVGGILMHLGIIYLLCQHQWNYIAIPWNVLMMVLLAFLWNQGKTNFQIVNRRVVCLCIVFVLPIIFGLFGFISRSFAYQLYTGDQYSGIVVLSDSAFNRIPEAWKRSAKPIHNSDEHIIDLDGCSMMVQGVPLFQAKRSYVAFSRRFIPYAQEKNDLLLLVRRGGGFNYLVDFWIYDATELNYITTQ